MSPTGRAGVHRPGRLHAVLPVLVAAGVLVWLAQFPARPVLLGSGLLLASLVVAWRPLALWLIVPAALPLLDLAPWSGRLFLDEYDALLALLLAVAWWRTPAAPAQHVDGWLRLALLAVATSLLLSVARALLPWPAIDANAFTNLTSPFNALRVGRGAAWGLLLWALARRQQAAGWPIASPFGWGMVLGLLGTSACVMAERVIFTHWWDVADSYRVAGPFSAMHTGGAYVECYLVSALPFLVARLWPPAPVWQRAAASAGLVAALYAVMVTFSRGGYAALLLGLLLSVGLALRQQADQRIGALAVLWLALLTAAVSTPVLLGSFAQSRLAAVGQDLVTREGHWAHTLAMVDPGLAAQALGMGLGQFPALDLLHSAPGKRSASYRLVDADGPRYLQLGIGQALYIEQAVAVRPGQAYQLRLRLRASAPAAGLTVSLCEKWLLTSATCASTTVPASPAGAGWLDLVQTLNSGAVAAALPVRPVKLTFFASGKAPLDLASIQLIDASGRLLLHNGRFEQGMDHWYFTSDQHLAWHAKSMPIAIYFDQGLLGLVSWGALLALALWRACRAAWHGAPGAVPMVAALAGFSTVGLVDTLIDSPRFLMLWLLLCCLAASQRHAPATPLVARRY